jgi:hypothetical protein
MSKQHQEGQPVQLEISIDVEESLWISKVEQARSLIPDLTPTPVGFEKYVREILYSNGYKIDSLEDLNNRLNDGFSRKEQLKIKICYLLDCNNSMTMADIYESLGESIKGEGTIVQGYNRIIWDEMHEDGISALIELEEGKWIDFNVINPNDFLSYGIPLKDSLANLPVAQSLKVWNKDYKNPRWLPVKYNAGLMLIATKIYCGSLEENRSTDTDKVSTERNSFLEVDRFVDYAGIKDERQRVLQSIVLRQGQPQFREGLLDAYGSKCAITDCDVQEALEAAHIIPYLGVETNHLSNGLILRADLHTLFDLFMFAIEPKSLKIIISPRLRNTFYEQLEGTRIRERKKGYIDISKGALSYHFNQCEWLKT